MLKSGDAVKTVLPLFFGIAEDKDFYHEEREGHEGFLKLKIKMQKAK